MPCIHFKDGKESSMLTSNVELRNGTILVTGAAGFIGANLVRNLLRTVEPITVIGLDSINNYYDVSIKDYRLTQIEKEAADHPTSRWEFVHGNIADKALVEELFEKYRFSVVVDLAAQAGIRHSIDSPDVYIESNISASTISWRPVGSTLWSIWYMQVPVLFTAPIRKSLIPPMTRQTTHCHCTQRLKRVTNCLPMLIPSFTTFPPPVFTSSPSMALQNGQTWLTLPLPIS